MNKLSLEEAKSIAYKDIGIDLNHENRPIILDGYTLDFDWGFVFYYNGKKAIETKNPEYDYLGNCPILVDKIDGTAVKIRTIGKIFDSEIENYREKKGYPQVIKFPIKEDISNFPLIDKVKKLFQTGEILQIKEGIKIVESNQLFDLNSFRKIIFNNAFPDWNFEEQIAAQFKHGIVALNSVIEGEFPRDLKIFTESTQLSFSGVTLERIPDDVLQLPNLERIEIWFSKINQITPRIEELSRLNYIEILDSNLGEQAENLINELKAQKNIEVYNNKSR